MVGEAIERDDVAIDFGVTEPSPPLALSTKEKIDLGTHSLRVWISMLTLAAFILVNGAVLIGLHQALLFDFKMIEAKTLNYQRFIDATVIASLLGATTIQLGAIMYTCLLY